MADESERGWYRDPADANRGRWWDGENFVIAAGAGVSSLIPVLPYFALATLMDMVADLTEGHEAT